VNHFQPGQHVRLTLPELGGLAAQVVEVAPDYLVMALFLNGRDAPSAIEYADVALEYTAARGLYRTRGTVRFDVGGVEILRFVPHGDPELIQRRGFARVSVSVPVSVRDDVGGELELQSIDLSGSGVRLARPPRGVDGPEPGASVWLSIFISEEQEPIDARGAVLRELGDGSLGVHFDFILDQDRERLVRFLFERQRLMRQLERG
jgi:c-di-GMP-binding flagellar brake protein YcgR